METKRDTSKAVKCLHCDEPVSKRGLCAAHYEQFRARKAAIKKLGGPDQAKAFDAEAVAAGRVLRSRQGKRPGSENVFDDIAQRYLLAADSGAEYDLKRIDDDTKKK